MEFTHSTNYIIISTDEKQRYEDNIFKIHALPKCNNIDFTIIDNNKSNNYLPTWNRSFKIDEINRCINYLKTFTFYQMLSWLIPKIILIPIIKWHNEFICRSIEKNKYDNIKQLSFFGYIDTTICTPQINKPYKSMFVDKIVTHSGCNDDTVLYIYDPNTNLTFIVWKTLNHTKNEACYVGKLCGIGCTADMDNNIQNNTESDVGQNTFISSINLICTFSIYVYQFIFMCGVYFVLSLVHKINNILSRC